MARPRNSDHTDATEVAQRPDLLIPTSGAIERPDADEIIIADPVEVDEYAAELQFLEEPVKIVVHDSTDKNATNIIDLYSNGRPQRLIRGEEVWVKRKYVEILANSRVTSYQTPIDRNSDNQRINSHSALTYPFSVLEDKNPKGRAWLKALLGRA
ncbi:hypothetical protein [Caudoviricetes sp.]|nr:hypothetical protein [Caudoviricetes sp.]